MGKRIIDAAGFTVGDKVRFAYRKGAVSAQSHGIIQGEGVIRALFAPTGEPPLGVETAPGLRLTCVFADEITHTLELADRGQA